MFFAFQVKYLYFSKAFLDWKAEALYFQSSVLIFALEIVLLFSLNFLGLYRDNCLHYWNKFPITSRIQTMKINQREGGFGKTTSGTMNRHVKDLHQKQITIDD